jgi:hypothetical protein
MYVPTVTVPMESGRVPIQTPSTLLPVPWPKVAVIRIGVTVSRGVVQFEIRQRSARVKVLQNLDRMRNVIAARAFEHSEHLGGATGMLVKDYRGKNAEKAARRDGKAHQAAGHESACAMRFAVVKKILSGIRAPTGRPRPARRRYSPNTCAGCSRSFRTACSASATPQYCFSGSPAFRRSELVSLDIPDVESSDDGMKVTIRRSRTDQEGRGRVVGIPYGSNPQLCG